MEHLRDEDKDDVTTDKMGISKIDSGSVSVLEFDDAVVGTKVAWTEQSGEKIEKAKNWLHCFRIIGNLKM